MACIFSTLSSSASSFCSCAPWQLIAAAILLTGLFYLWFAFDHRLFRKRVRDQDMNVIIIGAGFSGIGMGIKLKKAGVPFIILEKASDLGGTWWYNKYPGCACDIPSHLYSFSFEPKSDWSRVYPSGGEIFEYLRTCAEKNGLLPLIRFETKVVEAKWDETNFKWKVRTDKGDELTCRILVGGVGALHYPVYPAFKNDTFKGISMHTSEWDTKFDAKDKTIAVIGSGASAVQAVPELAKSASHLYVFQRTPPWVMPRPDGDYTEKQKLIFKWVPFARLLYRLVLWTYLEKNFRSVFKKPNEKATKILQESFALNFQKVIPTKKDQHKDLIPDYPVGCKRIMIHNDYYPTFNRDNVSLVTDPVQELTKRGLKTNKKTYELDAIIYATGFNTRAGHDWLYDRTGRNVDQVWSESYPQTYLGMVVKGCPNYFALLGHGSGLGHNSVVYMIECQITYIMRSIEYLAMNKAVAMEIKESSFEHYQSVTRGALKTSVWGSSNCTSWYKTKDGLVFALWPGHTFQYWWATRKPKIKDFSVTSQSSG